MSSVFKSMTKQLVGLAVLLVVLIGFSFFAYKKWDGEVDLYPSPQTDADTSFLNLPAGFSASVFAYDVNDARVMAFDPRGVMVVSQPARGKISALPDADNNGEADDAITIVDGLRGPHGIAFHCPEPIGLGPCNLYVAERNALKVFDYNAEEMKATNGRKLLDLPGEGMHVTRTLLFMPSPNENTLLISIGSSCNVCIETDSRRASIISYDVNTGESAPFATGLRNSVFMEIHPVTGEIWATDMGRDLLGDNLPPDEINIIRKGGRYGWPVCYGKNIHDTEFDKNTYIRNPCMEPFETGSLVDIPAHSAPLGLAFIPEEGWPESYWFNTLVAYHGSWNRSVPTGYKIVRHKFNAQGFYLGAEDFITGWMRPNGSITGRPADIKVLPGGTIYISDDEGGRIYRIVRTTANAQESI